ncbi:hypothetical protein NQ317_016557 [Molorchus minor]|uniref:Uncharacterized protein n=1 Tax=Molorchus minor TaxID=1323400 RepID=A0ABQ9IZB4_9CUCU|nr:hypothetical protein NQ317_016557 [Molorchus minor]
MRKAIENRTRCALCRLCLGQWSTAGLRLSAENGYLRFFTYLGLAMAIVGFLTAPKFIVGPFRSSGYANLTCNEQLNTMRYAHRYSPLVGGNFAANGVACGHASSRLENIVEADRRSIVWRFGESGGGYDGGHRDDSNCGSFGGLRFL